MAEQGTHLATLQASEQASLHTTPDNPEKSTKAF